MESLCEHINDDHIQWSIQGKNIYKDQCTRCFIEAKSDTGIAVCLKCFNGGCHQKHSPEHAQAHSHFITLNIRLYEIEQPHKNPEEINKLVIADIPQLEIETSITCLKCQKTLNSQQLNGLVQSIKLADSAFKRAAITQWEHVAQPCEHTLTLQQEQMIEKNLLKCRSCDLSANLWLCLTCGHVGCGRKVYDGSGGNNHAIDHSKNTGHILVVKLGTITPEGTADVHCYACDDEVVDQDLQLHLASFGIIVADQKKTEKTTAEINLDANLTLQLSKVFEEGRILNPVFGPGLTGIDNIGNSCYMNSVVQVVFTLPEFQESYGINHQHKCSRIPFNCQMCQISKVNYGLNSGEFSIKKVVKSPLDTQESQKDYYQDGIRLYDFKQLVAKGNNEFLSNRQQDAYEYFGILMNYFQKIEKQEKMQPLSQMFEYEQCNILQCMACEGYKVNQQKSQEFKVPCEKPTQQQIDEYHALEFQKYQERLKDLKPGEEPKPFQVDDLPEYYTTFEKGLETLRQGEAIQLYCPRCQANQLFIMKSYFKNYPKYLFVPINRFVLENWVPKKLNANIDIKEYYDFNMFRLPMLDEQKLIQDQQKQQEYTQDAVDQLMALGFSQNRVIRALIKYKNDVEAASMYIMETLDDPSQDAPIQQQQQQQQQNQINEFNVEQIVMMGFTRDMAIYVLSKTDNNVERAIDYAFNHDIEMEMAQQQQNNNNNQQQKPQTYTNDESKYELIAAIVHLGKSVHCGHYVSYIKKNNKWFLFNDAKVAESIDPALNKGYMYVFKRI